MRAVRNKNTKPEIAVRRVAHAMGYRFRLHAADIPGSPDIVFRSRKKVVFVHGCFWHGHVNCTRSKRPKSNEDFWRKKLERNMERDRVQYAALQKEGWEILVIWECETKKPSEISTKLKDFLR